MAVISATLRSEPHLTSAEGVDAEGPGHQGHELARLPSSNAGVDPLQ